MAATVAAYPPRKSRQLRVLRKRVLVYAGLCFYALIAGLPVYWMLITTFKPDQDLYNLQNFPLFFNRNGVTLRFREAGMKRLRIQVREDGVSIDQIVLSAVKYRTTRPGTAKNDTLILEEIR